MCKKCSLTPACVFRKYWKFNMDFDDFEILKNINKTIYMQQKSIVAVMPAETPAMNFSGTFTLYKPTRTLSSCVTVTREK